MLNEPLWLSPAGVIHLNRRAVTETGEPFQVTSQALLESACERPRNFYHYDNVDDVVVLGAALMFGIARNHPFIQGNKRTAFTAMIGFLGGNGYRFSISDHVPNADYLVAAIEGLMTDDELVEAIRPGVIPV